MLKEKKNLPEQEIKKEDNSINSLTSGKAGGGQTSIR